VWLALLSLSVLPASKTGLYVSAVGSMVALRSTLALFYELQMELNYPAPESVVSLLWSQVRCIKTGTTDLAELRGLGVLSGTSFDSLLINDLHPIGTQVALVLVTMLVRWTFLA
jgi:hypothetical protein